MSAAPATVLERVHSAAKERELAEPTLAVYRRTWLKLVGWTTAFGIDLGALPREDGRVFMRISPATAPPRTTSK